MKKIINQIARYIAGITLLLFVFLLSCMGNSGNKIADIAFPIVFILFAISLMLLVSTYITHLVWMIKEKPEGFSLKGYLLTSVILSVIFAAFEFFHKLGVVRMICAVILSFSVTLLGIVGKYIYSWKEDGPTA